MNEWKENLDDKYLTGGGDSGPGGDSLDSEDELDSTLVQNSASLSLEVDDLSPPLPSSSLPVPSLKPVLDDKVFVTHILTPFLCFSFFLFFFV